jgi:hypothetical protein
MQATSSVAQPATVTGEGPTGIAWFEPTTSAADIKSRVDWLVVFGIKASASPDEALFGTHLRDAINTIRNW